MLVWTAGAGLALVFWFSSLAPLAPLPAYPLVSMSNPCSGDVQDPGSPRKSQTTRNVFVRTGAARAGLTMGTTLAMVISWSAHQSILRAIIHGFLSWIYVISYVVTR